MTTDIFHTTADLLTEKQVAECFNISAKTLQRWRWEGKGPTYLKIGRAVRYDPVDLAAFIEENRHQDPNSLQEQVRPNQTYCDSKGA